MVESSSLSLVIDLTSKVPKYLQLQRAIEKRVAEGRLKPGQKLPSSRELVSVLGISRTSVLKAIDNLIAEGVLASQPKSGVYVARHQPQLSASEVFGSDKNSTDICAQPSPDSSSLLAFDSGADASVFPHLSWANCMKRSWSVPDSGVLNGTYEDGIPQLKLQICQYLAQLRGLHCKPSQIVIAAGNRDCLSIICHALSSPQANGVYLESACYPQISALMQFLNKRIEPLPIDGQGGLPPVDAELHHNLAILTPCRQFPLGMAMSSYRRQSWLDLLATRQKQGRPLWLIEDDYDNEFVYQGRVNVPLMQQDMSGSVFFVGSFSKVLFRGLRLSFIVSPQAQVASIRASQKALGANCSTALQPALAEFIASGQFALHLRKMRRHYSQKREFVLSRLSSLASYFEWDNSWGGMHICLRLKPSYCHLEKSIARHAKEIGLKLNLLSEHYLTQHKSYGIILGFTRASMEELADALDKLQLAVEAACD